MLKFLTNTHLVQPLHITAEKRDQCPCLSLSVRPQGWQLRRRRSSLERANEHVRPEGFRRFLGKRLRHLGLDLDGPSRQRFRQGYRRPSDSVPLNPGRYTAIQGHAASRLRFYSVRFSPIRFGSFLLSSIRFGSFGKVSRPSSAVLVRVCRICYCWCLGFIFGMCHCSVQALSESLF